MTPTRISMWKEEIPGPIKDTLGLSGVSRNGQLDTLRLTRARSLKNI